MLTVAPAPAPVAALVLRPGARPEAAWCSEIVEHARDRRRRCPASRCRGARPSRATHTRSRPPASAARAATATALVRQKPIGPCRARVVAGRPHDAERRRALDPPSTSATASQAAPAASRVARIEPGPTQVSGSSQPLLPPHSLERREVLGGMHALELVRRRLARLALDELDAGAARAGERGGEARRATRGVRRAARGRRSRDGRAGGAATDGRYRERRPSEM